MTLLLFDIDGTLLTVNGTGRTVLGEALSALFGQNISTEGVGFSGRTDPDIFRSVLRKNGLPETEEVLSAALDAYAEAAPDALRSGAIRVLPGVPGLLDRLADRDDVQLGLVTGNIEPIAYHKLRVVGLDSYFPVGAFGSDHAERAALPPLAANRAAQHTRTSFPLSATIVVGDTTHDIQCAREAGARSVAVSTGGVSYEALQAEHPDVLLRSLDPPAHFLRAVLRDA